MSAELQWLLVRNSSSFIVKQKGIGRIFSREPKNLVQLHSEKYSALTQKKAIGVEAAPGGRGVVITTKKSKAAPGAIKATRTSTVLKKGGSRRAAGVLANTASGYRSDVTKAAVARASAILRAQRTRKALPAKKPRGAAAVQASA